jgi:uncharacterized delta-60 repeat protein
LRRWRSLLSSSVGLATSTRASARGGKVLTKIGDGSAGQAIALQRDGKLVVAVATRIGSNWDFAVARYTTRGKLDGSFGRGGIVTTDFGSDNDYAYAVKIQPDGKIVVAGWRAGTTTSIALARYRPNGSLDPNFGAGGKVVGPAGTAFALALQRDGKLVAGGGSSRSFALFRFRPDGPLDPTFGANGEVLTAFDLNSAAVRGLALQADGKIVAVGYAVAHEVDEWALARFNSDGSLDSTFGSGGKVTVLRNALSSNYATAVALQGEKRILVAGVSLSHIALAGFLPGGRLGDGKIVIAGETLRPGQPQIRRGPIRP